MPGQECLEGLLGRLLCVKDDVVDKWWRGCELVGRSAQIERGLGQSRTSLGGDFGIMRHEAAFPRARQLPVATR